MWDLDSVGIRDKDTVSEAFEKNLSFEDGKYLALLTLEGATSAVTRILRTVHVARLTLQLKRLRKDPEILIEYDSIFQDQL